MRNISPHIQGGVNPRRNRVGFSLIEILIVIALIALLGTLTVGKITDYYTNSEVKIARIFVNESVKLPLTKYRIDNGSFPNEKDGGLNALLKQPNNKSGKWMGPYVEEIPEDPWGNPYKYRFPGVKNPESYDLWSTGANTETDEDDIGNWNE